MEQYISKSDLVAEIEIRKHKLLDHIICESDKEWVVRTAHQLNRILLFLDTLEVKEVDLDKELDTWRHNHFHGRRDKDASGEYLERSSQLDIAKHFFEFGMQVSNKTQKGEEV